MDPQAPASFIPKKPLVETRSNAGAGAGLVVLVSVLLFVVSLVGAGGVFAYTGILTSSIVNKDASLKAAEGAFEPEVIAELGRLDARLIQVQKLLGSHLAPSGVFDFLSTITLTQVQFTNFSFKKQVDGSAVIILQGTGDSFSTVALQSDQFGSTRLLKDVVFSDVAIGQSGKVSFSVKATVDPSLYLYSKQAASTQATPVQSAQPAQTEQATSTSQ
jgi:hypothetical protein